MLTLQNVNPLHFQHSSAPMSLLCSNLVQEKVQALSPQSRSFIGWFLSAFPVSCTVSFQQLPLGCFQNTRSSSHLHTFVQASPALTTSYTPVHPSGSSSNVPSTFKTPPSFLDSPHSFLCSSTYSPCYLQIFPSTVNPLKAETIAGFSLDPQCQHRA